MTERKAQGAKKTSKARKTRKSDRAPKQNARKTTKSGRAPKKKKAPASRKGGKGGGRGRGFWATRILALLLFGFAAGVLALTMTLSYYGRDLPTVDTVRNYAPPQTSRIVDRNGEVIHELFQERRTVVPMEEIPRVLVISVLAAEDADFYRHEGLDYAGIVRALVRDVVSGRAMQGASTITQQIVKNLLLTPERTIARKVRELILARRLEQELSKDEILWLYLNHINFGHGRYGVQEASRFYFGKDVGEIGLAEASLIAGIPQAPARLSPFRHPEAAKKRQRYVLQQLSAKRAQYWDDLSENAIETARNTEVALVKAQRSGDGAPEIVGVARDLLKQIVGADAAAHGGYRIETSVDLKVQAQVRAALRNGLSALDARKKLLGPLKKPKRKAKKRDAAKTATKLRSGRTYDAVVTGSDDAGGTLALDVQGQPATASLDAVARFNPDGLSPSEFAEVGARVRVTLERPASDGNHARVRMELGPQGAVVVLEPRTREVLAMVGGAKASFGFNRATQAIRQPGSTFKPIAYALALESRRYTPASLVLDAPEVFDKWKPNNYETWHYEGAVPLRQALAKSINLVAVRVVSDLTPQRVADFGKALGITTELQPNLSISLGASSVRPIELVNAYATFAAGGQYQPYRIVTRIVAPDGSDVPLPEMPMPREVLSPAAAYLTTSLLQSVVTDGTGRAARKLGRSAAGKTGTSNSARDAWFVGFTPEVVAGVWVGYDDHRPLGRGESGGKSALPIWIEAVDAATKGKPKTAFPMPSGIVSARIDPKSGLLAYEGQPDAVDELFLAGTVPTETAIAPGMLDSTSFMLEQLQGAVAAPPGGASP